LHIASDSISAIGQKKENGQNVRSTYPNRTVLVWIVFCTNSKPGFMRSGGPAQGNCWLQPTVHLMEDGALVFRSIDAGTQHMQALLSFSNTLECQQIMTHFKWLISTPCIMKPKQGTDNCDIMKCSKLWKSFFRFSLISRKSKPQHHADIQNPTCLVICIIHSMDNTHVQLDISLQVSKN